MAKDLTRSSREGSWLTLEMALDFEAQFGVGKDMVVVELGKVLGIVVGMVLGNLVGIVLGDLVGMALGIVVGMVLGNFPNSYN